MLLLGMLELLFASPAVAAGLVVKFRYGLGVPFGGAAKLPAPVSLSTAGQPP